MARPIWKGHISFGLVNIPVVLYSAEEAAELHFNLIDQRDRSRVRYIRVNESTGDEVPWNEIVKGYEYEEGQYVLLGDADFKRAAVEASQTVEIEDFVDADALDPLFLERPYYLVPDKRGAKGYVLLRETLARSGKVGIAKVVIHTRQHLAAVLPRGKALVLMLLRFAHELRAVEDLDLPAESPQEYKVSPKEIEMAEKLVESMSGEWTPEKYHDDYRDALLKWIEQKAKRGELTPTAASAAPDEAERGGEIVNIMDLLRKSVEQKGKTRRVATTRPRGAKRKTRAG